MIVYYSVVALVLLLGTMAQFVNSKIPVTEKINKSGVVTYKTHYGIFYYLLLFIFIFVGGFRYYIGTDYGWYYKFYDTSWTALVESIKALDEPGLKLVYYFARQIWNDGASVIFFACFITTILVFYGISKFDHNDITTMLLLYVFIAGWTFSFNGIRQAMAGAIIFAFSKVGRKNYVLKYLLVCLIAFLFHKSALMMFPILLLSHRKVNNNQILVLIASAVIIPLFFNFAFDFMGANTTSADALEYINREINPIRIAVAFAPVLLLIFVEDKSTFFEDNSFIINLVIFNAILSLTTRNSAYLNRFTHYTDMYLMVYYPVIFKNMSKNLKWIVMIAVFALYFFYWRYELTNGVDEVVWQWSFNHFGEY